MGNTGADVRLVVVDGDPSFVSGVADAVEAVDAPATAEGVTSADAAVERVRGDGVDGVVVGDGIEAPVETIERLDGSEPPVVVVADDRHGEFVGAAVEAGVVDCYPRTTAVPQYELLVETIRTERTNGTGTDEASRTGETDGTGGAGGAGATAPGRGSGDGGIGDPERAYREVFENVGDGLVVHDPGTGEIVDANERFCELNGYRREELVGETIDIVTAGEEGYDYEAARRRIERAAEEGPQLFEWRNERKDGGTFPVEVHLAVVRIDGADRVLACVRDITERKRREREYEQVFNGVNDSILIHDPETGELLEANDAFCELVGHDRETVLDLGTPGLSVTEEGYTEGRAREIIDTVADEGSVEPFEWKVETADGEHRLLEVTATLAEIGGEPRHLSIMRDITARRQREREYEQVFDGVNDAIAVFDPETAEIVDVNETYHELLGYEDLETIRELGIEGLSAADEGYTGERGAELIREVAETGEPTTVEWRGERADGGRLWLEATLAPAEVGGEARVLSMQRDVTERKRREREFEQIYNGVQDGLQIMDPDTLEILDVNEAYLEMFDYDTVEAVREQGIEGLSAIGEGFTPEEGRAIHQRVVETGEPELVEWRAETAGGERLWLELKVTPAVVGGEQRTIVVHRDITERKRRERLVRALHESTDDLQHADTAREVCEAAVAAAEEVLGLSMPACWLPADGVLEPVAASDAAWSVSGAPGTFEPGSHVHEVFEGDDLTVYDPREHREESPFRRAFLVPLGDHGLLGAAEPGVEAFDDVTLDAARILARHATSALDRVERARELRESERRFRTIAERVEEVIYMANADLTEAEYVNPAYADVYGRPVEELYEDARAFFRGVHPEDRDAFEAAVEAMLDDVAAGDPDDRYEFSYRVERPDGETRWIEATGYPILDAAGEPHRYVAVAEDATERHRRERTLETFHEATRELTGADSREAAARQAVRAADEVLGFPLVSAHLYDGETGRLEPVAVTDRLAELDVAPPAFGPGDSLPWQVYVEGESTTSTEAAADSYGPGVSGPDVVLPLGSHGVMLVGGPGSFDAEDVELAQILAATLEASLNHVAGERELAEREAQLREQQARAERLQRLNDIIRDIEQATIERSARAGIEAAVCERLIEVDAHELVWIAEPDVGGDALLPRTSDGGRDSYIDALSLDAGSGAGGHPAIAAYRNGESRVVSNVATEVAGGGWRTTALGHGIQSVVAVPISHENTVHGVLAVESTDPDAFDEATREVLTELGRSIGYAITVTEREQALESEGTTELEFAVDDEGLFMVRAADGCRVELERTIRRTGGSFSTFYAVEGAAPGSLVDLANAAASVERAQVVSADDDGEGGLIEVRAPTWFGSVFTDHGAVVREAVADAAGGRLVVEAPRGANVRALVEGFQERYPGAELVAQRQRERTVRSLFELQDTLAEELTDRQWEALETAYSAGYFAWPRETSGQEVAELLGVTQPTFNKHLRIAERTAFRILLDREYPDTG